MIQLRLSIALFVFLAMPLEVSAQELPPDLVTTIEYCGDAPTNLSEFGLPAAFVAAAEQAGEVCIELEMPLFQYVDFEGPGPYCWIGDCLDVWTYDSRMTGALTAGAERIVISPFPGEASWSYKSFGGGCPASGASGQVLGEPTYDGESINGISSAGVRLGYSLVVGCEGGCGQTIEPAPDGPPAPAYQEAVFYGPPSCIPETLYSIVSFRSAGGSEGFFELRSDSYRSFTVSPSLVVSVERDASWGSVKARFKEGN